MQPIINYIKHPSSLCDSLVCHLGWWLPDSVYLRLRYRFNTGKRLNLKDPKSFSEKLQWLKLHDRNPEYTKMVDKILVKEYVAGIIGSEHVIPLLGVWNKPEDIDWDMLPNQFVLKTNHSGGSTGVVICKNKAAFDTKSAIVKLNKSLKSDVYRSFREWPYKNVERKVFAEKYIEPDLNIKDLPDYKWFCFDGEPQYCQVIQNRSTAETIDFFDTNWVHQVFVGLNPVAGPVAGPAPVPPIRPVNLDLQIRMVRELSKGLPFVRIDLYETDKKTYFGEITFYPLSGMGGFDPEEWDYKLGELIKL